HTRCYRDCSSDVCSSDLENNPIFLLNDFPKDWRQCQLFERRNFRLQLAHHDSVPAILLEDIDAKSRKIFDYVTAVARTNGREFQIGRASCRETGTVNEEH